MSRLMGQAPGDFATRFGFPRTAFGEQAPASVRSTERAATGPAGGRAGSSAKVAILLGTYHGQEFLAEQLDSFEVQTHANWEVWASDDGSTDGTQAILEAYRQRWGQHRLSVQAGPAKGFSENFLSLTCNPAIQADYYAFSDQDDIWEPGKLERALAWLETVPQDVPALYCARTRLVDAQNREIGVSPLFTKPPSFANALVQSIGGGNTMVFNNAARALLRQAGQNLPVITHDWWAYMAVTGCGGRVHYDREPMLRYRQHEGNLVGMNSTWAARLKRVGLLWQGRFRQWSDGNIAALQRLEDQLTPENREVLRNFARGRQMSLVPRVVCLLRSGIHRQTLFGNLGLAAAAVFRKI